MFSGTGPCGLAHSPAGDVAAADMKRDDPRIERVAAVSKTCDTCLCGGTAVTARRDAFIGRTGVVRAAEAMRNITKNASLEQLGASC